MRAHQKIHPPKVIAATVIATLFLLTISTSSALLTATATNTQTNWNQQTIDTGGSFGPICLAVDSQNNPHVVYNGQNGFMYYASWDGQKWSKQGVVQGGEPDQLVLDSHGNPYILYKSQDGANYLASWNGQNWVFQSVPTGCCYALALDSTDTPHLAFTQQLPVSEYPQGVTNNIAMLNYASWTGADWSIQKIDSPVSYTDGVYLAFDSQNNPHIMYGFDTYYPQSGGYTKTVKFAAQKGSNWTLQSALASLDSYSNMALDSNGQAHFSYTIQYPHESTINGTVGYASWNGVSIQTEPVVSDVSVQLFSGTEFALGNQENPHIEFFNGSLLYASRADSNWNIETVAPDKYAYSEGPLVLDSNGNQYICYWVDDIRNTQAFVSQLLITSTLPLANIELPQATPTSTSSATAASQLWSFNPACPQISQPTLVDGRIYFLTTYSGAGPMALYCLDPSTGAQIWNKTADSGNYTYIATYTVADGRAYIGGALPGTITCLNVTTGAVLWNYSSGGTGIGSLTISGDVLYAGGDNYAYRSSGSTDSGIIAAFDASTGKVLWIYTAPSQTSFDYNNPIVKDGVVYVVSAFLSDLDSSWHGTVIALNASSGKELWSYTALSDFRGITLGDQLLYIESTYSDNTNSINVENVNGKIYQGGITALNTADGTIAWNYPTSDTINSLSVSNGTVYAVSDGGNVYSLGATSGKINWHYNAGLSLGNLIDAGSYLYVGSTSGVYCLDKTNGEVIWSFAENSYAMSSSTIPTLADGVIYIGWNGPTAFVPTVEHNLYALDASSGQKLWNYTLPNAISNAPIVFNGVVYVAGDYVTTRSIDFMEPATFYALEISVTQQNTVTDTSNGLLIPAVIVIVFVVFLGVVLVVERLGKKRV